MSYMTMIAGGSALAGVAGSFIQSGQQASSQNNASSMQMQISREQLAEQKRQAEQNMLLNWAQYGRQGTQLERQHAANERSYADGTKAAREAIERSERYRTESLGFAERDRNYNIGQYNENRTYGRGQYERNRAENTALSERDRNYTLAQYERNRSQDLSSRERDRDYAVNQRERDRQYSIDQYERNRRDSAVERDRDRNYAIREREDDTRYGRQQYERNRGDAIEQRTKQNAIAERQYADSVKASRTGRTDSEGNEIYFDEATNSWKTKIDAAVKARRDTANRINTEQLVRGGERYERGQQENNNQRNIARNEADVLLERYKNGIGAPSLEGDRSRQIIAGVTRAGAGRDSLTDAMSRNLIRSGRGGASSNLALDGINNASADSIRVAIANANAEAPDKYRGQEALWRANMLNSRAPLAAEAAGVPSPTANGQVSVNLDGYVNSNRANPNTQYDGSNSGVAAASANNGTQGRSGLVPAGASMSYSGNGLPGNGNIGSFASNTSGSNGLPGSRYSPSGGGGDSFDPRMGGNSAGIAGGDYGSSAGYQALARASMPGTYSVPGGGSPFNSSYSGYDNMFKAAGNVSSPMPWGSGAIALGKIAGEMYEQYGNKPKKYKYDSIEDLINRESDSW